MTRKYALILFLCSVTSLGLAQSRTSRIAVPLFFEANHGQTNPQVRYLTHSGQLTLFLTNEGAVLSLANSNKEPAVLRMQWVAGAKQAPVAEARQAGVVNYLIGDAKQWRTGIPTFERVRYREIYRGIDVVFHGKRQTLEYDLVVKPGANPKQASFRLEGGQLALEKNGDLLVRTPAGELRQPKPVVYQIIGGKRRLVAGGYRLEGGRVSFEVGKYDRRRELVIDPTLSYSTYLGGSEEDRGASIAVDSSNRAYVTGNTRSPNFPVKNAFQSSRSERVAFVTKFWATGGGLIYSTYFGSGSHGSGIAVDRFGNVYFTGGAASSGTPGTQIGSFDPNVSQAFVAKLSPSGGRLLYSLKFGGNNGAVAQGIAIDSAGQAYVTGDTSSGNFPTTPGAFETSGQSGPFVVKVKADGSGFAYATYVGGFTGATSRGIAVDSSGQAYIAGRTTGTFPTTPGAFQASKPASTPCDPGDKTCRNPTDGFVAKLNSTGSALIYSTYLGGQVEDEAQAIAIDSSRNAYVTGQTFSPNYPTTAGAFRRTRPGASGDSFVTKLNASGSGLAYSTLLAAGSNARSIAVNSAGHAFVAGGAGPSFPLKNAVRTSGRIFVAKLWATGGGLHWSTRFGGGSGEIANAVRLDGAGNPYVTGITLSPNFPTTSGAFDRTYGGNMDAFLFKISN